MRNLVICSLVILVLASRSNTTEAQDNIGAGATAPGDILRGEGVYLKGLGSWQLNDARAREIEAKTKITVSNWYIQYYDWLQKKYNARVDKKIKNYQKLAAEQKQKLLRLRDHPSSADIQSGEALNVLLTDLSDPSIAPSAWRQFKVQLPSAVSIRTLAFKFAEKDNQGSRALNNKVIAIGKLDLAGHWPRYLPENRIGPERKSYEATYKELVDACKENKDILDLVLNLKKEIDKLKARVALAIPNENQYQEYANRFAGEMKKSAEVFNAETMDFASDFIADSHRREAETVGDLLAFMSKYRLYFAKADGNPDTTEAYDTLYRLLKQQSDLLGLKPGEGLPLAAGDNHQYMFKAMQGLWYGVPLEPNRIKAPHIPQDEIWTLELRGDKYKNTKGGQFWSSGSWFVDSSKSPVEYTWRTEKGQGAGTTTMGIVKWDGNDLIRCQGPTRPRDFESVPSLNHWLMRSSRLPPP